MPTYSYACKKCDHRFEALQKISDEPIRKCPECGGETRRVFHPVGIIFKGSGFYTTDYARKGSDEKTKKPETKKAGADKVDVKSEKKPETTEKKPAEARE